MHIFVHGFFHYMFAQKYISKQAFSIEGESPTLPASTHMVVVIPCYDEPELDNTLHALMQCKRPACSVVVLIVVNHHKGASCELITQNQRTLKEIENIAVDKADNSLTFVSIYAPDLPPKHAGAGLARKIGMDEAVRHFNAHNKPNGIIVSLDADTLLAKNYLVSIYEFFNANSKILAATIYFEHPLPDGEAGEAIILYELYMRYYRYAMQFTGFPHAIYTVGSAFAVRASAYVAQGGMNRKKAGEDFYFLHKLTAQTEIGFINQTAVYPSARASQRVPFGTGVLVEQYLKGARNIEKTYPLEAFKKLKGLFVRIHALYSLPVLAIHDLTTDALLKKFLEQCNFIDGLIELKRNCSNAEVFEKRFFHLFNAFKLLKWLNFAVENKLDKKDLVHEASVLYAIFNKNDVLLNSDAKSLLIKYRELDRNRK